MTAAMGARWRAASIPKEFEFKFKNRTWTAKDAAPMTRGIKILRNRIEKVSASYEGNRLLEVEVELELELEVEVEGVAWEEFF